MKKPTHLITHYKIEEPSSHGWIKLIFFTTQLPDQDTVYRGFGPEGGPLTIEDIRMFEARGSHEKFVELIETDTENILWMDTEGIVWLADKENPSSGEKTKIFVQDKPAT